MIEVVRYWPLGKPIPRGWKFAGTLQGSHGHWSILIEKVRK